MNTIILLTTYDRQCIAQAYELLSRDRPPGLSIETLAVAVGLNRTKLQYGFKQLYGVTIYDFQVQRRLEKAKQLLLHSEKPIKVIASLSGYRSSSSFGAAFKKFFGSTPREFRQLSVTSTNRYV